MRIADKSERVGVLEKMESGIQEERKVNFFGKESDMFPLIKEESFFFFLREAEIGDGRARGNLKKVKG